MVWGRECSSWAWTLHHHAHLSTLFVKDTLFDKGHEGTTQGDMVCGLCVVRRQQLKGQLCDMTMLYAFIIMLMMCR